MSDLGPPLAGALLGLVAGYGALRVNGLLARRRELAAPRFGALWLGLAMLCGAGALWRFGVTPHGVALVLFGVIALAVTGFDFAHRRIPNEWSAAIAGLGLIDAVVMDRAVEALATGIGGALLLFAFGRLYGMIRGREGVGFGDVKLVVGLGLWLGPQGLIWCFLIASLATAVIGGLVLVLRGLADDPPFGPALLLVTLALLLAGLPPY